MHFELVKAFTNFTPLLLNGVHEYEISAIVIWCKAFQNSLMGLNCCNKLTINAYKSGNMAEFCERCYLRC